MYVAVDIALNKTGIAVLDSNVKLIRTLLLKPTTSWNYYRKLDYLYREYTKLFENLLTDKPERVILLLEGRLKAGWRASSMASIEGARVTCYLAYSHFCEKHGFETLSHVYDPNIIKSFIADKRSANKDEMYEKAISRFSHLKELEFQEDIFDAIYLALYHIHGKVVDEHPKRSKVKSKV